MLDELRDMQPAALIVLDQVRACKLSMINTGLLPALR